MTHFKAIISTHKYGTIFSYEGIELHDLATKIEHLLLVEGYRIEGGGLGDAMFVKGDATMRMFFGAFVKYYKLRVVTTKNEEGNCLVDLRDATPELSGGLMGIKQTRKEIERLKVLFEGV